MVASDSREYPETHSVTGGQGPPPPGVAEELAELLNIMAVRPAEKHDQLQRKLLQGQLPDVVEGPSGLRVCNPEQ